MWVQFFNILIVELDLIIFNIASDLDILVLGTKV